jgi:hypothetical protein
MGEWNDSSRKTLKAGARWRSFLVRMAGVLFGACRGPSLGSEGRNPYFTGILDAGTY